MNSPLPRRKTILLAVRAGVVEPRLLGSARALCQRLEADLEILARFEGERLPDELGEFIRALQADGLVYRLTPRPDLRRRDIVQYANAHECVVSVVIDSLQGWESVAEDRASDPWAKLACPLVTAA